MQQPAQQVQPATSTSSQTSSSDPFRSVDDFFNGGAVNIKPSADTIVDADTGARLVPDAPAIAQDRAPMDDAEALKQTQTLMHMRETGQAVGLSWIAEGDIEHWEQYKYQPFQFSQLVNAWQPIIQSTGLRVNKWVNVLFWEGLATGPMVMTAMRARQYRLENDKLKEQLYQYQVADAARQQAQQQQPDNAIPTGPVIKTGFDRLSYDSKRMWEVDKNGFFLYNDKGWIKEGDRREKPLLTAENYQRLIKWNTKEKIDQIFKV